MEHKRDRLIDELKKYITQFIQKESNQTSMITLTNIFLTSDFKKATFFVTVFPENQEDAAIDFLQRNQYEAREFLKKNGKLSRIPFVTFELDKGEKSRQRLDEISSDL